MRRNQWSLSAGLLTNTPDARLVQEDQVGSAYNARTGKNLPDGFWDWTLQMQTSYAIKVNLYDIAPLPKALSFGDLADMAWQNGVNGIAGEANGVLSVATLGHGPTIGPVYHSGTALLAYQIGGAAGKVAGGIALGAAGGAAIGAAADAATTLIAAANAAANAADDASTVASTAATALDTAQAATDTTAVADTTEVANTGAETQSSVGGCPTNGGLSFTASTLVLLQPDRHLRRHRIGHSDHEQPPLLGPEHPDLDPSRKNPSR